MKYIKLCANAIIFSLSITAHCMDNIEDGQPLVTKLRTYVVPLSQNDTLATLCKTRTLVQAIVDHQPPEVIAGLIEQGAWPIAALPIAISSCFRQDKYRKTLEQYSFTPDYAFLQQATAADWLKVGDRDVENFKVLLSCIPVEDLSLIDISARIIGKVSPSSQKTLLMKLLCDGNKLWYHKFIHVLLDAKKADLDKQDKLGNTALMYSIMHKPNYATSLLEHGANPLIKNNICKSAFHLADKKAQQLHVKTAEYAVVQALLNHAAERTQRCILKQCSIHHEPRDRFMPCANTHFDNLICTQCHAMIEKDIAIVEAHADSLHRLDQHTYVFNPKPYEYVIGDTSNEKNQ